MATAATTALLQNISVDKDSFFIIDDANTTKSLKFVLTSGAHTLTIPDDDIDLSDITATSLAANSITVGTGPVNISSTGTINIGDTSVSPVNNRNENINIGTGDSTGAITIGNNASTLVDINALAINIDSDITDTTTSNQGTRIEGAYNFAISKTTTTSGQSVTNEFTLADNKSAYFVLHIIADNDGVSPFSFFIRGLVKNNGTNTSLVFSNSRETRGTIPAGADVQVTGDTNSDEITVTCTGPTAVDTIDWRGLITFYTTDTAIYRSA